MAESHGRSGPGTPAEGWLAAQGDRESVRRHRQCGVTWRCRHGTAANHNVVAAQLRVGCTARCMRRKVARVPRVRSRPRSGHPARASTDCSRRVSSEAVKKYIITRTVLLLVDTIFEPRRRAECQPAPMAARWPALPSGTSTAALELGCAQHSQQRRSRRVVARDRALVTRARTCRGLLPATNKRSTWRARNAGDTGQHCTPSRQYGQRADWWLAQGLSRRGYVAQSRVGCTLHQHARRRRISACAPSTWGGRHHRPVSSVPVNSGYR